MSTCGSAVAIVLGILAASPVLGEPPSQGTAFLSPDIIPSPKMKRMLLTFPASSSGGLAKPHTQEQLKTLVGRDAA